MKHTAMQLSLFLALCLAAGCKGDPIEPYDVSNSAVVFETTSTSFSMKGNVEPKVRLSVPVRLIGPKTDYDRTFLVEVRNSAEDNAELSRDYEILSSVVKAGEISATVEMEVNDIQDGVERMSTTLAIVPNEHFVAGFPAYSSSRIVWSEEYVRPKPKVWGAWYAFFSQGYSRRYHELLVEEFGEEVERYVNMLGYAKQDTTLIYKPVYWWFEANRKLQDRVSAYDKAHPGAPLMHSSDYEFYSSKNQAVGEGKKPEVLPTILETLNAI